MCLGITSVYGRRRSGKRCGDTARAHKSKLNFHQIYVRSKEIQGKGNKNTVNQINHLCPAQNGNSI